MKDKSYLSGYKLYAPFEVSVAAGGKRSIASSPAVRVLVSDSVECNHVEGARNEMGNMVFEGNIAPAEQVLHHGEHPRDSVTFTKEDGIPWIKKTPHRITTTLKFFGILEANAYHTIAQGFILKQELVDAMMYMCSEYNNKNPQKCNTNLGLTYIPQRCKTYWEFKHNFCGSALGLSLRKPKNDDECKKMYASAQSMKKYAEMYATRSMLEDQCEMKKLMSDHADEMSTTITNNFDCHSDPLAPTFGPSRSFLPFENEILRYPDMGPLFESVHSEHLPVGLMVADVVSAVNANGHHWSQLEELDGLGTLHFSSENSNGPHKSQLKGVCGLDACRFLAKCLTVCTYDGYALPYVSDYMVTNVLSEPVNNTSLPFTLEVGEDMRQPLRHPYYPKGRIQAKDCDGQSMKICTGFKTVKNLDMYGDVNDPHSLAINAMKPYLNKKMKLFSKLKQKHYTTIFTFLAACHKAITTRHIRFNNPLGGACAASAQDANSATDPQNLGGHSWASLEWYAGGEADDKPTHVFLMEGTSPVQEISIKQEAITSTVLCDEQHARVLAAAGFKDEGVTEGNYKVLTKQMSPMQALQMAEMSPHLAPIQGSSLRPEIPYSPLNHHFQVGVDKSFYLNVYFGNGCVYSYTDPATGTDKFGTPWPSFNHDLPQINIHRISPSPNKKLECYTYWRLAEICPPLLDKVTLTERCSDVWAPLEFIHKEAIIPMSAKDPSINNKKTLTITPFKGKNIPITTSDEYQAVTVCDSFESTETAKKWFKLVEDQCVKANAEFDARGDKHFMTCALDKSGIMRTFYLYMPDLSKKHVVSFQ